MVKIKTNLQTVRLSRETESNNCYIKRHYNFDDKIEFRKKIQVFKILFYIVSMSKIFNNSFNHIDKCHIFINRNKYHHKANITVTHCTITYTQSHKHKQCICHTHVR